MKSTTSAVISNAVRRLVSDANAFTVKRKYKTNTDGLVKKWWFVIRGDEEKIMYLQREWGKIEIQTGWRLEPVYEFVEPETKTTATDLDLCNKPSEVVITLPSLPSNQDNVKAVVTASPSNHDNKEATGTNIPCNANTSLIADTLLTNAETVTSDNESDSFLDPNSH